MADLWQQQVQSKGQFAQVAQIDRIEVMVLLDLIGAANPHFVNFYQSTQELFIRLSDIERSLLNENALEGQPSNMFVRRNSYSTIDDDHRPFIQKGLYSKSLDEVRA